MLWAATWIAAWLVKIAVLAMLRIPPIEDI
jgi:hypothetical protein